MSPFGDLDFSCDKSFKIKKIHNNVWKLMGYARSLSDVLADSMFNDYTFIRFYIINFITVILKNKNKMKITAKKIKHGGHLFSNFCLKNPRVNILFATVNLFRSVRNFYTHKNDKLTCLLVTQLLYNKTMDVSTYIWPSKFQICFIFPIFLAC